MKDIKQIKPEDFVGELVKNNMGPVVEVPCSYLKDFLNYLWDSKALPVINPANEALVMGIAAGEYLGTGKIPVVAIQNSGLMNTLNAITSLHQIYDISAFMMVTWRGKGGVGKDAPEHDITGENLEKILKTFQLPYEIADPKTFKTQVKRLAVLAKKTRRPVVFVVKKDTFEKYDRIQKIKASSLEMTRFDAISEIKKMGKSKALFVSATGFPTRDSFNAKDTPDFYIVGSMGHAFAVALGVSPHTKKKVIVLDGDGGALMHAGGFASLDPKNRRNIIHVILDNEAYESTGGQPAPKVNFVKLAEAFGYPKAYGVTTKKDLTRVLGKALITDKSTLIHVKVKSGDHAGGRVSDKYSCPAIVDRFMGNFKTK